MATLYRIIPRLEPYTARDGSRQWSPVLFFPDGDSICSAPLSCYSPDEGHSSASPEYYATTRKADAKAIALAHSYAKDIKGAVVRLKIAKVVGALDWVKITTPQLSGKYGAPMGRHVGSPANNNKPHACGPIYCRKLALHEGYDVGGAYWGIRPRGVALYCVYDCAQPLAYLDATSRTDALRQYYAADGIEYPARG